MIRNLVIGSLLVGSLQLSAAQQPALAQSPNRAPPAEGTEGPTVTQGDNEVMLNSLRQQPVYIADNLTLAIGEVDDVLMGTDGTVKAVIIDIGRGSRPKQVAVSMAQLDIQPDRSTGAEPRQKRVVLKGTRADLEKAPTFVQRPTGKQ